MAQSLLETALELSSEVRQSERDALDKQQETKRLKKEVLLNNRLEAATKDYVDKLHYRSMFDSAACWKNCKQVDVELKKIKTVSGKKEALKDQIRIRVLGLGWEDCHHAWSHGGTEYTPEELANHLKDGIIQKHKGRKIPKKPPVDLPTRKDLPIVGSLSPDIVRLDAKKTKEEIKLMEAAEKLMKELEEKGLGDRIADMQQKSAPKVDTTLVGQRIEVLSKYLIDGEWEFVWAKGKVVGLPEPTMATKKRSGKGKKKSSAPKKANDIVIIAWDDDYCCEGEPTTTKQKLHFKKWNKHGPGAWRFVLEENGSD